MVWPKDKGKHKTLQNVPSVEIEGHLFERSDDWQIQADLNVERSGDEPEQKAKRPFPPHITSTRQRPDAIMWSDKLKTVMWVELTSPWEENMERWFFEKHERYNKLAEQIRAGGWTPVPLCVEVGSLGYVNNKWRHMTAALGMSKAESRRLRDQAGTEACRCSYYLNLNRGNPEWFKRPILDCDRLA